MFELEIQRQALKFIKSLPPDIGRRIMGKIELLAEDPRPFGYLKLTEFKPDGYRIRVGKYRVLYRIDDDLRCVRVFHVDLRDDAYSR